MDDFNQVDLTNIVYTNGLSPSAFGLTTIFKNEMKAELEFIPCNGQSMIIEHAVLGRVPAWQANIHDACMEVRDDFTSRMKEFMKNRGNHG